MTELTPYDTGDRLEPQLWVRGETASPGGLPRRAIASDYGRVDFDADDGTTILTLYIERVTNGYRMHVDSHSDDYLHVIGANEPPALQGPAGELDADYRAEQMMLLDSQLRQIGAQHSEHVVFYDGDPLAFSPGHFVFHELEGRRWFAVEELYPTGDAWGDPDRVPIGWAWREQGPVRMPDGSEEQQIVAEGTIIPSDTAHLVERAQQWAHAASERAAADEAPAPARHQQRSETHRDSPSG